MGTLKQANFAATARNSAEQRTMQIGDEVTTYWFYPARKKSRGDLVLIHGYRGNHHGLEAIAGAIESLNVYIPDLPGFGKSTAFAKDHSIENYAEWLNDFLGLLGLSEKPHLLGHSFGSIVVSAYASKFHGIESLILENPVAEPALKGPKALLTLLAKMLFWFAGAVTERFGDAILQSWPMVRGMSIVMTKSRFAELRKWIHTQHDQNFNDYASRRVALEGYTASISNCVSDFTSKFTAPVLMLTGERDDITSMSAQRKLFVNLPGADNQMIEFGGVGHLTHYEIPEQIAGAIENWCSDD